MKMQMKKSCRALMMLLLPLMASSAFAFSGGGATSSTFSYTGSDQSFTVPAGITSLTVKLWGAGGAGGVAGLDAGGKGGGGAFVTGTLAVTPGEMLALVVGGGGNVSNSATYGGGGAGAFGGSGGGRSAIRRASTELVTASGGGGGSSCETSPNLANIPGGAGGLTAGSSGANGTDFDNTGTPVGGGGGGTQTSGGAGGAPSGAGGNAGTAGTAGSMLTGGGGGNFYGGGGGGGGYFGGGGGGGSSGFDSGAGGGGGSSFLANLTASGGSAGGAADTPGGNTDANYLAGIGTGGVTNGNGGNGRIVLSYAPATNNVPVVATNTGLTLGANSTATIDNTKLKVTDADNNPITYTLSTAPTKGTLKLNGTALAVNDTFTQTDIDNNLLTFTAGSTLGSDSFDFSAADGQGGSVAGTFNITINEVPSLIVTTDIDNSTNTDGLTSLREAIAYANAHPNGATPDAITFASPLFDTAQIISLGSALNDLSENVTITGPGANLLTVTRSSVNGTPDFRIFTVGSGKTVSISGLTISNGRSSGGGGISNSGTLTVGNCTLSNNSNTGSGNGGAGIYNSNSGTLTVENSILSNNSNTGGGTGGLGGGIYNAFGTLTVKNSTLSNNSTNGGGGGIFNRGTLTVENSTLSNNSARFSGGGISNSGTLTVKNSTLSNNSTPDPNISGGGGGIYNGFGTLTVENSTLSNNSAVRGGGIYSSPSAFVVGQPDPASSTLLRNSTISGNSASTGGGGIYSLQGLLRIESCTIAGNSAPLDAGSGVFSSGNNFTRTRVQNSIIADNRTSLPGSSDSGTDVSCDNSTNSFVSLGFNLIGDGNGIGNFNQSGDQNGGTAAQLKLSALADNGGPTQTMALQGGSLAINAGDTTDTTLTTDQRGVARPQVNRDDIGAFELQFTPNESLVVTTTADEDNGTSDPAYGSGTSLREAIAYANSDADASEITFSALFNSAQTILLGTALNDLSEAVTITGPGANLLTIEESDSNKSFAIFQVKTGVSATFSGLTVSKGFVGIYNFGTAIITNCTASGNSYGFDNFTNGLPTNPTMTVTNCTASGNTNSTGDGVAIYSDGTATITNTTVTGNNSAISITIGSTATIASCTVSGNSFYGIYNPGASATIKNTIATNNAVGDVSGGASGTFVSGGYNLIGDGSAAPGFVNGVNGDQVGTAANALDAKLSALADNGGPTKTMALLPGSPAQGKANAANAPATDQRGFPRPQPSGGKPDIGAFESEVLSVSNPTVTETVGGINADFVVSLGSPALRAITFDAATQDYSATAGSDYTGLATTSYTINVGETSKTISVPVLDDSLNELQEAFRLLLSNSNQASIRSNGGILGGRAFIDDNDPLPTVSTADLVAINEGNSGTQSLHFSVRLSAASSRPVVVTYSFGGTATYGSDYTAPGGDGGTLTFTPGQTNKAVAFVVQRDTVPEADETIRLQLLSAKAGTLGSKTGTQVLTNDDALPKLSINDVTLAEGSSGTTNFVFTVSLSKVSGQAVTVSYQTGNGSAVKPGDYSGKAGTLTFAPNETTKTITVTVVGDAVHENDETFTVDLSNAAGATISDGQGQGTILDDDASGG